MHNLLLYFFPTVQFPNVDKNIEDNILVVEISMRLRSNQFQWYSTGYSTQVDDYQYMFWNYLKHIKWLLFLTTIIIIIYTYS